ncbi:TetR/AcrR family transcriptional regulator [Streptomyces pactum]|uniref:TetR/AcrR family transcriptional regulator n=1 Tax=Streptomyces pactum TaxID=68249 RepID=A0ABS0NTK0_9ACTN|nr:TetR/AcrR family transcriptional regulator [Streptomyces pactum]MBH5338476.1 TetR/AcrR family transcriptional regulator [Streptomyces pactum]
MSTPHRNRRSDYAEATRLAIVEAARQLFSHKGYFATTVEEIAAEARVAPTTVYAVGGGKQGLLRTLVDIWSQAPVVAASMDELDSLTDPDALLRQLSAVTRSMRESFGDIMRILIATAPHNEGAAEGLAIGTRRYRDALATVAAHLRTIGGTHPEMTVDQATDILWFYFGYSGYFTLVDQNGWSYDQAESWLAHQATMALRAPRPCAESSG